MTNLILIRGARLHNLKNISLEIPKEKLVVLTGVSGSGKSTLGFDILVKEGQRQYLESLGVVGFGMSKPPVDLIRGLSPTVSLDQRLTNHSPRSTVGTATEVYTYLRVLFARLGRRPCPACGEEVPPAFNPSAVAWEELPATGDGSGEPEATYLCPHCGSQVAELSMAHFSFNKPEGACPTCTGLGTIHTAILSRLVDEHKSIPGGAVLAWNATLIEYHSGVLQAAAAYYGFDWDLSRPVQEFTPAQRDLLFYGAESPQYLRHYPQLEPPTTVRSGRFEGLATNLLRRYAERILDADYRQKMEEYLAIAECPECRGTRLGAQSRAVLLCGQSIVALVRLSLVELGAWLEALPDSLTEDERLVAGPVLAEMLERIQRLVQVGAGYLSLERDAPSLSAGESQRLRLAGLLGSWLSGVLYVFDEPTVGLHPRDTHRMIEVLRRLRDLGNTVLVIEHDLEMIAGADYVIDFGPGAGKHGGQIVAAGKPAEIAAHPASLTSAYLSGRLSVPIPEQRRPPGPEAVVVQGACHHNLQNLTVRFPLGLLVAVTGVSGAGKSSLVFDILGRAARRQFHGGADAPGEHTAILGLEHLDKVIQIDQAHAGRVPRSNAATYTETFTPIREAFAATENARRLGFTARHFSFNTPGGRCERCQGSGTLAVNMHFMPEVEVTCPACHGRRFTSQVLGVRYQGMDISQVLELTVDEALGLFQQVPAARVRLQVLADVGLGYLQLGQPAVTLSGGEAQRIKLARELGRRSAGHTLYLLDEPTTGLHPHDVTRLLSILQRLVAAGHTVIVVEHNRELVRACDWVIELGPEGGAAGGRLIAAGPPA
jgi:excinuclease ABC subunit A